MNLPSKRDTEREAEFFIKTNLKELGWDIRNPERHLSGQLYTQNQCLEHPEIKRFLAQDQPEYIVKLSETKFWVIEAKRYRTEINIALDKAENQYAKKINQSKNIKVVFITGVAGNDTENYEITTKFLKKNEFKTIILNNHELTGLPSPKLIERILQEQKAELKDIPIDETVFLNKAEKINEILHNGAINKSNRARVMAALLLSLAGQTPPNVDSEPLTLIEEINARVNTVLKREGKPEFYGFIKLNLPSSVDNHTKFKIALVQTLQELINLNIRSAMRSGTDVLGKFYEVFLKYGNGAKEIGIVLTPRHITKFSVEVVGINNDDIVFDPCCGTGGFLVAAFDEIIKKSNTQDINKFKKNNLFGIEQEDEVVALAIVNMIFRGDGKNHIIEGNCYNKNLHLKRINGINTAEYTDRVEKNRIPPVTRVLMNPPFALKKEDEKEYKFVECALKQMEEGGLLFSILPLSVMVKGGKAKEWRKNLLKENTLLSVITFPNELFYPIGVNTVGIFVMRGVPHENKPIYWIKTENDGFIKSKGKRLPNDRAPNDLKKIKESLHKFIKNPSVKIENIPQFQKVCPINFDDSHLELVPEAYLDSKKPELSQIKDDIDSLVRENVAFLVRFNKENNYDN